MMNIRAYNVIILCVFVVLFNVNTENVEAKSQTTLAIITSEDSRKPDELIITSLEVNLSKNPHIRLIERNQIQHVLNELKLSAFGLSQSQYALRLGQLLPADIFIFVEKVPKTDPPVFRIRMVESRTGVVMGSLVQSKESIIHNFNAVYQSAKAAIEKHKIPIKDRHYIGILGFRNEEPGSRLDGTAEAIRMLITVDLNASPEIVVLDREHLSTLQSEQSLSGIDLQLKNSAVLLDGGIKYTSGQKKLSVSLFFRSLARGIEKQLQISLPIDDIHRTRKQLAHVIRQQLNVGGSLRSTADPAKESQLFLNRVSVYLSSGDMETAVRYAEVAYALDKNQMTRYWVARCWYLYGKSLSGTLLSDQFAPGITRVKRVRTTTDIGDQFTAGNTSALKSLSNVDKKESRVRDRITSPSPRKTTPTRQVGQDLSRRWPDIPADKKKQALRAFVRAYGMMDELSRVHAHQYESGLEKNYKILDPTQKGGHQPQSRSQEKIKKKHEVPRDSDKEWFIRINEQQDSYETKLLFEELKNIHAGLLDFQLKYYQKHYGRRYTQQLPYWNTWLEKKKLLTKYYHNNSRDTVNYINGLVEAFISVNRGEQDARIRGFWDATELAKSRTINDEEQLAYEKLTGHEDPFVRIVGHRRLMRFDHMKASEGMLRNFVQHFPYEHPYRNLKDESLIPQIMTPAVERLAVADAGAMLRYVEPLIDPLISRQDAFRIVKWRDVFWPYIRGLQRTGQDKKAHQRIMQTIQVMDQGEYGSLQEEGRRLRAQLDLELVHTGYKKAMDPELVNALENPDMPYYIRKRPELEAPNLDGPIELPDFYRKKDPEGPGYTTRTISKTRETFKEGSYFISGTTVTIDSEGNEQIVKYHTQPKPIQKNKEELWDKFRIKRLPTKVVPTQRSYERHQRAYAGQFLISKNMSLYDQDFYFVKIDNIGRKQYKLKVLKSNLFDDTKSRNLGEANVNIENVDYPLVTATTVDDDYFYVGTLGGLIRYPKDSNKLISQQELNNMQYQPYYLTRNQNNQEKQNSHRIRVFNEANGFPNNNVLSLAHYNGLIYVGMGPVHTRDGNLIGKSGLATFNPGNQSYEIISSSSALVQKNGLDGGENYQITTILADHQRQCLWLSVAGNKNRNGIWQYIPESGRLIQAIKEDLSVQAMKWFEDNIIYHMRNVGLIYFKIDERQKKWLIGYTPSAWTGVKRPVPPRGINHQPVFGNPKTRLWPFAASRAGLFTLGWDQSTVMYHQKGKFTAEKRDMDESDRYMGQKQYLGHNQYGIWVINEYGHVFLISE